MASEQSTVFFSMLADPTRLRLLQALAERPHNVTELVNLTGEQQPNVSHSLSKLYMAGLVQRRKNGREVVYSIQGATMRESLRRHTAWMPKE